MEPNRFVPALPLTLKGLERVVSDYKKTTKVSLWDKTRYKWIKVVTRVVQTKPNIILSDNTANYSLFDDRPKMWNDPLLKSFYYEILFELTPHTSDNLHIVSLRLTQAD